MFGRARSAGLTARLVALCAVLLVLSAGAFAILLTAARDLRGSDRGLRSSLEVIVAADQALRLVVDLETGLRGYVITSQRRFLEPYDRARRALPGQERSLVSLTAGDPRLAGAARRIVAAIDQDRRFQAAQVALARRDRHAAAKVIATGAAKRRVDAIRREFAGLLAVQGSIADAQRASARDAQHRLFVLVITGLLVVPLLVLLLTVYAARGVVTPLRRIAGAARRMQGGALDVRVDEHGLGEVCELAHSFNAMAEALERGRDALEHHNAELEAQGNELAETVTALALEKERIERFHAFVELLASEPELDRLSEVVLERMTDAAHARSGTVYVLDPAAPAGDLHLAAARGVDAPAPRARAAAPAEQEGMLHLPLRAGGLMLGLLTLHREGGFEDRGTLQRMSGAAAVALSNAFALALARRQADVNRAVLETAHDAYAAVDADLRITAWTPQAEALSGYPASWALGRRVDELLIPERRREAYRAAHREMLADAEAGNTGARRYELPIVRRDGRELRIELSTSPLKVGERWTVNGFMRDITEERARERAREAQRAVSLALAEAEPQEDVMPRVLEALGRELRRPLAVHWVPEDGGMRRAAVWRDPALPATVLPGAVVTDPGALPLRACREGRPAWQGAALALPITSGPDGLGVLEFWDRRAGAPDPELADALLAISTLIAEVLERRRAEAEAERLKNEFFALVSHELRTPLTSIIGYLELILDGEAGEVDPQQRRFLGVIDRNARRLLRLVGDLLFVAQFEAGKLSLEHGTVDLQAVTLEAVEAARPRAKRVDVELEGHADPVPPLQGDRDRLGQVVDNLISNALKFTPAGGRVTVRAGERDGRAVLEVCDTGIGIPTAEQSRLFERFYRTASATERSIPGIGLGLSICRAIAEAHGGSISVASEEGRGTTVTVELPLGGRRLQPTQEVTGVQQR